MNPFREIYDVCNAGTAPEKADNLPDFPRIIDVELTNTCNFRCKMCPTGNLSLQRKGGFMTVETLKRLFTECIGHTPEPGIRFIGWGEPTLHPEILPIISVFARSSFPTHINTNGSKLPRHLMSDLINAGLSSIKFSFQGVDAKSYEEMRSVDFFEEMLETIATFREIRGKRDLPWIAASTTTTYESPAQLIRFVERITPLVDELSIGKTVFDFMDFDAVRLAPKDKAMLMNLAAMETAEKRHPDPCPQVFDSLTVQWDGSVRVCCNDFNGTTNLGNINETPLTDIWRHEQIERYRQKLALGDYTSPLCRDCYDYMGVTA